VGYQSGNGTFTYGNVSVTGSASGVTNAVIVKYDSAGRALWARSTVSGSYSSEFNGVAVSPDGYVYAAGFQTNMYGANNSYNYGSGSGSVTGSYSGTSSSSSGFNAVIVKYDSTGTALKAQSTVSGSVNSQFRGVAADGSGVYAVGNQNGTGPIVYGTTISATANSPSTSNSLIVKYDSDLVAQWAKSTASGSTAVSQFNGVAVDGSGVYAVGNQAKGTFNYGTASFVSGYEGSNAAIVKYNSANGTAQLAKSIASALGPSLFYDVATDGSGKVYAVGTQRASSAFDYGNSVTAQGNSTSSPGNAVIVQYDVSLNAQWAQSTTSTTATGSAFNGVATDGQGNVYAAGFQNSTGAFNYGGAGAKGSHTSSNAVVVLFNPTARAALWAKAATIAAPTAVSLFNGIAADSAGNVTAAGYQTGGGTFDYGGASATGGYTGASFNAVVVEYR
jgi:hypothetical protein